MMTQILPATVEELNLLQHSTQSPAFKKPEFDDITVDRKLKREISLPNGLENWNISNFDSYLNFDDNAVINQFDVIASPEDRLVPESSQRGRCSSASSTSSSIIEVKRPTFHNFGVKTFSTVCVDSGSTCISSEHPFINTNNLSNSLDPEETYQNLDLFLQEVPDVSLEPAVPSVSSLPSSNSNDGSSFELTVLQNIKSYSTESQDSFTLTRLSSKRSAECDDDDVFGIKQAKCEMSDSLDSNRYQEIRRKNNIASKNCRKTRKEKQKDMETKVTELEQEKEFLKAQVRHLEELIQVHKTCLLNAIIQKR